MSLVNCNRSRLGFILVCGVAFNLSLVRAEEAPKGAEAPAADQFTLPENATAAELLKFMRKAGQPTQQFKNQEEIVAFVQKYRDATSKAADQLLAGEATDQQKMQAVELKVQALSTAARFGDANANAEIEEFLHKMIESDSPKLADQAKQIVLVRQIANWNRLGAEQKEAVIGEVLHAIQGADTPHSTQVQLVSLMTGQLSDDQLESFVKQIMESASPELVAEVKLLLLERQFLKWAQLEPQQKQAVIDEVVQTIQQSQEATARQAQVVAKMGDQLSHSPEREQIAAAIEALLPTLQRSSDQGVVARVPKIEGLVRRLRLPGNEMEVSGTLLNGEQVDWTAYRGKVVLVDFWATWCGPCRAEVPNVLENYKAYHDKGFDVLGISLDTDKGAVEKYLQQSNIPWPTLFSADKEATGWNHPMVSYYGINGIPSAILVDAQGKVVEMNARGPRLGEMLHELLGEPIVPAQATDESASDSVKQTSANVPN